MLLISKPERYDAFLPPTPVTREMRQQIDDLAEQEKVSRAHIMRQALAFFLRQSVNNSDIKSQEIEQSQEANTKK